MLVSAIVNLIKVSKTTKLIKLVQLALFVAKRATLPENAGTIPPDHPLLTMPTIHKDTGDARYTLRGAITALRHPIDQAMPPTLNHMTFK